MDAGTRRISSTEMPASAGVQGPGETTIWVGWSARTSSTVISSLRITFRSGFNSPMYCMRLKVKES
jgi:hypothetical protein